MKEELELRILDVDVPKVIKKLEKLGAKKIGNWDYKRYVYDTKPYDENKWIRLRTNGDITTLTYKEYNKDAIDGVNELEIEVSDLDKTIEILKVLGYKPRSIQENKRIRYMLDDVEIDIDTWPHMKPYIEVEASTEKKVYEVIDILKEYGSEVTALNAQALYMNMGFTQEDLNNLRFEGDE